VIDRSTFEKVTCSPTSFDPAKMFAFQERHMARLLLDDKAAMVTPFLQKAGLIADPPTDAESASIRQIVEAAGDRIKVAGDILDYADFFTLDESLPYDEKAFEQRLRKPAEAKGLLTKFRGELAAHDAWDVVSLEALLKGFVEREGTKIGLIINALRVATTGKGVGFGMYETLVILGKERSLRRIDVALSRI
jgi:glutamyl-tRNA synthetase